MSQTCHKLVTKLSQTHTQKMAPWLIEGGSEHQGSHFDPNATAPTSVPNVKEHSAFERNVNESAPVSHKSLHI